MKALRLLFSASCLLSGTILAADLKLKDGREFKNYTIVAETATTVTIRAARSIVKVSKTLLPSDVLAKYPIDEAGVAAEREETAEGKAVYDAQVRATAEEAKANQARKAENDQKRAERAAARTDGAKAVTKEQAEVERRRREADQAIVEMNARAAGIALPVAAAKVRQAAQDYAAMYFRIEYIRPAPLVLDMKIRLDEPRAVPAWANRYEATGLATWSSYIPQGSGFTNDKSYFEATVDIDDRGQARVTSFTPRSGPPLSR